MPTGHSLDANTFALWQMDIAADNEAPVDDGPHTFVPFLSGERPIAGQVNNAALFADQANPNQAASILYFDANLATFADSSNFSAWSWEGVLHLNTSLVSCPWSTLGIVCYGASNDSPVVDGLRLSIDKTAKTLSAQWNSVSNGVKLYTSTQPYFTAENQTIHLGVTASMSGTLRLKFYLNGVLTDTFTPSSGDQPSHSGSISRIGNGPQGQSAWWGWLDTIKLSTVERTQHQILSDAIAVGLATPSHSISNGLDVGLNSGFQRGIN